MKRCPSTSLHPVGGTTFAAALHESIRIVTSLRDWIPSRIEAQSGDGPDGAHCPVTKWHEMAGRMGRSHSAASGKGRARRPTRAVFNSAFTSTSPSFASARCFERSKSLSMTSKQGAPSPRRDTRQVPRRLKTYLRSQSRCSSELLSVEVKRGRAAERQSRAASAAERWTPLRRYMHVFRPASLSCRVV